MSHIMQPLEIQDRLRKRYIDRLSVRVKKLRKDHVERNWASLKSECRQLVQSAENFGFRELARLAREAEQSLPDENIPSAVVIPEGREAVGNLITAIEAILAGSHH